LTPLFCGVGLRDDGIQGTMQRHSKLIKFYTAESGR